MCLVMVICASSFPSGTKKNSMLWINMNVYLFKIIINCVPIYRFSDIFISYPYKYIFITAFAIINISAVNGQPRFFFYHFCQTLAHHFQIYIFLTQLIGSNYRNSHDGCASVCTAQKFKHVRGEQKTSLTELRSVSTYLEPHFHDLFSL